MTVDHVRKPRRFKSYCSHVAVPKWLTGRIADSLFISSILICDSIIFYRRTVIDEYIIKLHNGKKCKHYPKACLHCGEIKYYIRSVWKKHKFCSPQCTNGWKQKQAAVQLTCTYCGKVFERAKSKLKNSRKGFYFCCRKHKDLSQRIGGPITPKHYKYGDGSATYRRIGKHAHGTACSVCGYYDNICSGIVEFHHIDRDRTNSRPENLIPLCPTCHAYLTRGYKKLEGRHKLVFIKPVEEYLRHRA